MATIIFRGEPWTLTESIHDGTYNLFATNVIREGLKKHKVAVSLHNWKAAWNYSMSVYLDMFPRGNNFAGSEIMHSGFARPKYPEHPEWSTPTLQQLVESFKKNPDADGIVSRDLTEGKLTALSRIKNARIPKTYQKSAEEYCKIFPEMFLLNRGEDMNRHIFKLMCLAIESRTGNER